MTNIEISNKHSKQQLVFFVAQDIDDSIRNDVNKMLANLGSSRRWVIGPPEYIDITDDNRSRDEDVVDETVGGVHEIYSAAPANGLPRSIDLLLLEEVEQIVESVRKLSEHKSLEFEFELDGRFVGSIEDGVIDLTLQKGFLDEWRKHIASMP